MIVTSLRKIPRWVTPLFLRLIKRLSQAKAADLWRVVQLALMVNGAFALVAMAYIYSPYRLAYNNTWSMPKGLWYYPAEPQGQYEIGMSVVTGYHPPKWVSDRPWSDKRHRRLVKDVAGVPGDHLRVRNGVIDNCGSTGDACRAVATRLAWDGMRRPLYFVPLPEVIPPRQYLLLGENPMSLDSRYLGLFDENAIRGQAHRLLAMDIPDKAKQLADWQAQIPDLPLDRERETQIPGDDPMMPAAGHPPGWAHYDENGTVIPPSAATNFVNDTPPTRVTDKQQKESHA